MPCCSAWRALAGCGILSEQFQFNFGVPARPAPPEAKELKILRAQNRALKKEFGNLKREREFHLVNSMGSLVQSAFLQNNITSFNPIIEANIYAPLTINWMLLTYMYKTHGIIQTAIDVPILDAIRGGLDLKSGELDPDELKDIDDDWEEFGILDTIGEASKWARLYGGAALIINTEQDPSAPLNLSTCKKMELYAANRWELGSPQRVSEYYDFYGKRLHNSRVITIKGKEAPYILRWQLAGWGMSEIERMVEDFNRYIKTNEVLYELLHEAKVDVYRLKNLNVNLATAAGTAGTQKRVQLMNQLKSFQDALVMDMDDEYEQKQITFSGLAEVVKENRISIASALRMPMTKLFGLSATGLNAGEEDLENYNAMVESEVRQPMRKVIRKVMNLYTVMKFGFEADIHFSYKPLRVLSAVEEETVKTSQQNRFLAQYDRGLLDSHEFGQIAEKEKLNPIETAASQGILDDHPAPAAGQEGESKGDDDGKD